MAYSEEAKQEIFNTVIHRVKNGDSLRKIIKELGKPEIGTFYDWLDADKEKQQIYARACSYRAEQLFDEIEEISRNTEMGEVITESSEKGVTVTKSDMWNHRRLKVDSLKWMLAKMNPRKYGDKIDIHSNGEQIANIAPVVNVYTGNAPKLANSEEEVDK